MILWPSVDQTGPIACFGPSARWSSGKPRSGAAAPGNPLLARAQFVPPDVCTSSAAPPVTDATAPSPAVPAQLI